MALVMKMVSFSHWGMFEVLTPYAVPPVGYAFRNIKQALKELHDPAGLIEIVRL